MILLAFSLLAADLQFTDVSQDAGVAWNHTYNTLSMVNYVPAGVAVGDVNGDGWPDLYVTGGENESNALFINQGNGTFTNTAEAAGVDRAGNYDCGPSMADIDGDGDLDLFVGSIIGSPGLYRNRGDGTFEDITQTSGLLVSGNTFGAAFADTDRDGDLDIFMTHWMSEDRRHFFVNNGDGTFSDATETHGFADQFQPDTSFTPNFGDINGDHWPDLLIASDFGHSRVFLNDGRGHFVDHTDPLVITDEDGMGASLADYDNDGDLDWFVSAISPNGDSNSPKRGSSGNRLYRNKGDGTFEDYTDAAGVREGFWGWGAKFADFDNDGYLDLFHTNGFRGGFIDLYGEDTSRFFHNNGDGTFKEMSAEVGLNDTLQGRAVATLDYDLDGDLDLYIANNGQPGRLLRNDGGNAGNYLNIELNGRGMNQQALGARVEVTADGMTQLREIHCDNSFASHSSYRSHFGLGSATIADVRVTWPDGLVESFVSVPTNKFMYLSQPDVGAPACDALTARWLPHLTPAESGFDTRVVLKNFSAFEVRADIVGYDADGNILITKVFNLGANEQSEMQRDDLFGDMAVSHLALYAPESVKFSSGYQLREGMSGIAHFHEDRKAAHGFFVYPGNWDIVYDGMALLNLGDVSASVDVAVLDGDGEAIQNLNLTESLLPKGKLLSAFNDVLESSGSMIKVTSTQPATVMFLRGTQAGIDPGLLYAVTPIPVSESVSSKSSSSTQ